LKSTLKNLEELMKSDMGDLKFDMGVLKSDLGDLRDQFDLMRSDLENVYEVSARLEIAKNNGTDYASNFKISDLNGFIRLAMPQKKFSSENPMYDTQSYVQAYRVDKFSNYMYVSEYKLL
jgi:hypothetical protein